MATPEQKERLRSHLQQLVRERDPYMATAGHFYVQQYIQAQLSQWGTVEIHEFSQQQHTHANLILNLPGKKPSSPPILIGAHYDAVPGTPGADDNATGVAALLELAQTFSSQPANYPLRLIAFDLEEYGMVGSAHYAELLHQQGQKLRLMLSLEMLGYCTQAPNSQQYPIEAMKAMYPSTGNFIGLIGNLPTTPDLLHFNHHIFKAGVPSQWLPAGMRGEMIRATRLSDHSPFWDRGYRAMMVTDTAFMRNPHYHQPSDRLETLDLDFLAGICQGLIQAIQTLK
ncbi:MAG: M20/M25/M40 family metallo-hydrolase [Leptolyngbyaceae cyanobacterium bins.302]|nr:M20/M25/M40 family metallo-hydrolase [Leptolyngbyaceae cyanobacterium bins.302]